MEDPSFTFAVFSLRSICPSPPPQPRGELRCEDLRGLTPGSTATPAGGVGIALENTGEKTNS